ncbi:MAG: response regulator [Gemmatimonadaceae bacterium]
MIPRRTRVLIADDHPLMGQGLSAILRPTCEVVGVVQDGREVPDAVAAKAPDLLLLDLSMPHRNGLDLLPQLVRSFPKLKVVIVTMHVDRAMADAAIAAGAHGFVPKESSSADLNDAIEQVMQGKRFISPKVPRRSFSEGSVADRPPLSRLTPRQKQILLMVGGGKTSQEIAEAIGVSYRTVEFHRASVRRVLGVTNEVGMLRYAMLLQQAASGDRPVTGSDGSQGSPPTDAKDPRAGDMGTSTDDISQPPRL